MIREFIFSVSSVGIHRRSLSAINEYVPAFVFLTRPE